MKSWRPIALTVAIAAIGALTLCTPQKIQAAQPLITIKGPTLIAFFKPVTEAALARDEGLNSTLDDFSTYLAQARDPLQKKGIKLYQLSTRSIRVRVGQHVSTVVTGKYGLGYYLIAPGKKPRFESEVMTDAQLLQVANEYFSSPPK